MPMQSRHRHGRSGWIYILFDQGRIAIDDKVSKADMEILVDH